MLTACRIAVVLCQALQSQAVQQQQLQGYPAVLNAWEDVMVLASLQVSPVPAMPASQPVEMCQTVAGLAGFTSQRWRLQQIGWVLFRRLHLTAVLISWWSTAP
jgi:hypothetical protein